MLRRTSPVDRPARRHPVFERPSRIVCHRRNHLRNVIASTAVVAFLAASAAIVPSAVAQELTADGIIAELEELARETEENSQDVLRLSLIHI